MCRIMPGQDKYGRCNLHSAPFWTYSYIFITKYIFLFTCSPFNHFLRGMAKNIFKGVFYPPFSRIEAFISTAIWSSFQKPVACWVFRRWRSIWEKKKERRFIFYGGWRRMVNLRFLAGSPLNPYNLCTTLYFLYIFFSYFYDFIRLLR